MDQRFPARAKNHAPRQKRRWFLFSQGGLPPFQPGDPSATASLCGNKERGFIKLSPGPFCLRRLLSCPGNKKIGLRSTNLEMIHNLKKEGAMNLGRYITRSSKYFSGQPAMIFEGKKISYEELDKRT